MSWSIRLLLVLSVLIISAPFGTGAEENVDFELGDSLYQQGKGDPKGFPKALESFKVAAEAGHVQSQHNVGRMYQLGHGVAVDLKKAERWYLLAGENGSASSWSNLGNVYKDQGRSNEEAMACFKHASEMGSAMGTFNMGNCFRGLWGMEKDHVEALKWFNKLVDMQSDYPRAWNVIGLIHLNGGFGVEPDVEAAEKAFLNGVRETNDEHCNYNLYYLYSNGRRPSEPGERIKYLKGAAEQGSLKAATKLGDSYLEGWNGLEKDRIQSAYYYDIASRFDHGQSIKNLDHWSRDKRLIAHFGEKRTGEWRERKRELVEDCRKEVKADLLEIRGSFESAGEEEAFKELDGALNRWKKRTEDGYTFFHMAAVWTEAQIRSGRENLKWGRILCTWQTKINEADTHAWNILAGRANLNGTLTSLGSYGLLRQSCSEVKRLILELEGVDIDSARKKVSIGDDYELIGGESIPLVVDLDAARENRRVNYWFKALRGELIGGQAMNAMQNLATESLSVGDWESVLFYGEWLERWSRKVEESGKGPPRGFPGCVSEVDQMSEELKANAFSALGLLEMEAAACRAIIDMDYQVHYGKRRLHKALYRLDGVRVAQGRAGEVDIETLIEVEEQMRSNAYERKQGWQYPKLVRARVVAALEGEQAGIPLVNEVLSATADEVHLLVRLEALLVFAELKLNAGNEDGVEDALEEALGWAREKGLLLKELKIYELYVQYLISKGDHDQALEMQRRVIALIDGLNLKPRRESQVVRLARIYALRDELASARVLLAEVKDPELGDEVKSITDDTADSEGEMVDRGTILLQPLGIQTMPIGDNAEAIFILSNPKPNACSVELIFESEVFGFEAELVSVDEIAVRCERGQKGEGLKLKLEVPGASHVPVVLSASDLGDVEVEAAVKLMANVVESESIHDSEWKIQLDGDKSQVAVVDAARLGNNAFNLVPVYHHLESPSGSSQSLAVRFVASEPTRVEGYAADGTLLFVDAQGNGSFRDPGDLLATEEISEIYPMLRTGGGVELIGLSYQPESRCANGRVEIRIETSKVEGEKNWTVNAIDWLEP